MRGNRCESDAVNQPHCLAETNRKIVVSAHRLDNLVVTSRFEVKHIVTLGWRSGFGYDHAEHLCLIERAQQRVLLPFDHLIQHIIYLLDAAILVQ